MPVAVVVGGQYGSEGKGKMTSYLALNDRASTVVRCGGPNAGHTVVWRGHRRVLRQVPAGFINPEARLLLAAGSIIDPILLLSEVAECGVTDRLGVDGNAAIMGQVDSRSETELDLQSRIGSTLSGTGVVTSRKVLRDGSLRLAKSEPLLARWIVDTSREATAAHDRGELVVIEGTQGFGLSLHHGGFYPFATSRDTTASAFLSEAGLSPFVVSDVILVIRTYPIRVGGNSGPLINETTWAHVQSASGAPHELTEFTTVTSRPRRVAIFDFEVVERAVAANKPTHIAVHGLDYLNYEDFGKTRFDELTTKSRRFVDQLETRLKVPASFLFTGPDNRFIIDRRFPSAQSYMPDQISCLEKTNR